MTTDTGQTPAPILSKQQRYRQRLRERVLANDLPIAVLIDLELEESYQRYSIYLNCGHRLTFRNPSPLTGDIIWCRMCWDEAQVVRVNQWRAVR